MKKDILFGVLCSVFFMLCSADMYSGALSGFFLSLFYFAVSFFAFRYKTFAILVLSVAGYFCYSFYYDKNIALQNAVLALFLIVSLFLWYKKIYLADDFKIEKPVLFFVFPFCAIHLSAYGLMYTGSFDIIGDNLPLALTAFIGEIPLVYAVVVSLFDFFDFLRNKSSVPENAPTAFYAKHVFVCSFSVIALSYLLFDFIYYPGKISPDMINQIRQNVRLYNPSQHHPYFSSLIMWLCFEAGAFIKDHTFGLFCYIMLQNIVCAAAFSLCLKRFVRYGLPVPFLIGSLVFFSFVPFGLLAVWGVKDVLYSGVFVLFVLQTIDLSENGKTGLFLPYALTGLLICLLRNNGVYVVVPVLLYLSYRSAHKKAALASLFGILSCFILCTKVIFPSLGFPEGSKREMFSLPFQQTALYIRKHKADMTPEETQTIESVLSLRRMEDHYRKNYSDPIKRTYKLDGKEDEIPMLADYFAVWMKMFFKHPLTYYEAALFQSSLYYTFLENPPKLPAKVSVKKVYPKLNEPELTEAARKATDNFFYSDFWTVPFLYIAYNCCVYTFLFFVCVLYVSKRHKEKSFALFVPLFFTLLICIASPVNGILRYIMPLMASMPLCIGYACFPDKAPTDGIRKNTVA